LCASAYLLIRLVRQKHCGENVGVSRGPEENKKAASCTCKPYVLAPALINSQRCGQSENAAEQEKFFAKVLVKDLE
jgi:hypothetical protein